MLRSEAIKQFLTTNTHQDLAEKYYLGMECQLTVLKLNGVKVDREYEGKRWLEWQNPETGESWKPFRIPYAANSNPQYNDTELRFNLDTYAEGIGMTGWNWEKKQSCWVGFDFDTFVGHSEKHAKKLSTEQLENIKTKLMAIPWVQIRRSTGGLGLHVYVYFDPTNTIEIANHTHHAAVARAILSRLSLEINHQLINDVDICGGNMWIWHRKMTKDNGGLTILKAHSEFGEIPADWQDHLDVVTYKRSTTVPKGMSEAFLELSGQRSEQNLEIEHLNLIKWLIQNKSTKYTWFWNEDHKMLVTHTLSLRDAHKALGLKGNFETISTGSTSHNCFCFPIANGIWVVRRYGTGVTEASTWTFDKKKFSYCFLNKATDIFTILKLLGATEHPKEGFVLSKDKLKEFGEQLKIAFPMERELTITPHKKAENKICLQMAWEHRDPESLPGWILERKKWKQVITGDFQFTPERLDNFDNLLRHVVDQNGRDGGWFLKVGENWNSEPLQHLRAVLASMSADPNEVIGQNVLEPWKITSIPFGVEYPGNRQWNRNTAQFRVLPQEPPNPSSCPTWNMIYDHCGEDLAEYLKNDEWARENGITTGGDYLRCWVSSLLREPRKPLPYLFFWSKEQKTGKSIFHEAMTRLIENGYMKANTTLDNQQGFNGELEKSVVCGIDEYNLGSSSVAYNRIKDWVTADMMVIHPKSKIPYLIPNTTHWIHTANNASYCPILPGDTRIMVIKVNPFRGPLIAREQLFERMDKEAPYFLYQLLKLELPPSRDRLNVPVIDTQWKQEIMQGNSNDLVEFLEEFCTVELGTCVQYAHFYNIFQNWLTSPASKNYWTRRRLSMMWPEPILSGKIDNLNLYFIANLKFRDESLNKSQIHTMTGTIYKQGLSLRSAPKLSLVK